MNREDIYNAITNVDERYIDEAAADIQKGRRRFWPWLRYGVIAACLVLMVASPLGRQAYQFAQAQLRTDINGSAGGMASDRMTVNSGDTGDAEPETAVAQEEDTDGAAAKDQPIIAEDQAGTELFIPEGTVISEAPETGAIYCYGAPKDGTWFFHEGVKDAMAEHSGEEVYYFLAIDLFQGEEWLDPEGEAAQRELSRLRGEGYFVGLSEAPAGEEEQMEIYAAGYFTAEELERFAGADEFGYAFYFRSEEYWNTGEGIYLAPMPE